MLVLTWGVRMDTVQTLRWRFGRTRAAMTVVLLVVGWPSASVAVPDGVLPPRYTALSSLQEVGSAPQPPETYSSRVVVAPDVSSVIAPSQGARTGRIDRQRRAEQRPGGRAVRVTVRARATEGRRATVTSKAAARVSACPTSFRPASTTLFNDPTGSAAAQERILRHVVKLIDCTPPLDPDGGRAAIRASFYSLSYRPVRAALVAAAARGVSVQVMANSHADRFRAWEGLVQALGSDATSSSFAVTCWQGCLGSRQPPAPDGPTAWFTARALSKESPTTVFTDLSKPGAAPIRSWDWSFGDGTGATGPGPHSKTYSAEGLYRTTLTVVDAAGRTHSLAGTVTVPDFREPMIPSLHSKLFLFSTVGTGSGAQRWVSAYGSGNPTYQQAREGFNNLNVTVGNRALFRVLDGYFDDLVAASQGRLLTADYSRSVTLPAAAGDTPRTDIHFLPRASGDTQLEVLRSIQCRYGVAGELRRTVVRVSMFAFTRAELAAELWRLAYERGCLVDVVYAVMTQRLRGENGTWLPGEAGAPMPWGPADCLATPPTGLISTARSSAPMGAAAVAGGADDLLGLCAGGPLDGRLTGSRAGVWVDRVSSPSGGRLIVTASCPVEPYFDPMLQVWAFRCAGSPIFTHQKVMLVDGFVRGRVQKYVMTGSANWSETGLKRNDEMVVELQDAPQVYAAYLDAFKHQKHAFAAGAAIAAAGSAGGD